MGTGGAYEGGAWGPNVPLDFVDHVKSSEVIQFLNHETTDGNRHGVPMATRLTLYREGFYSQAAVLYDLDRLDEYVSDYARAEYGWEVNGEFRPVLDNKLLFRSVLGDHAERLPAVHYLIENGRCYPVSNRGNVERAVGTDAVTGPVDDLLDSRDRVVVKPLSGGGGRDVHVCERRGDRYVLDGGAVPDTGVREAVESAEPCLLTDHLEQAEYAARLYPDATNTIRLLTMVDPETGEVFVPTAVHRIGGDDSAPVDNWSSGGYCAPIDLETGRLGAAVRGPESGSVEWYDEHPDSGVRIADVEVPRWNRIRRGVVRIASDIDFVPYVGWDVVVTDDSFRIIEANTNSDVDLLQVHEPLLADDRTRRFYEHHGLA
ncbi:MAG: sugar-transfer associated ATP-grasp domain-containing protein [Haloarculaceae archaeon]